MTQGKHVQKDSRGDMVSVLMFGLTPVMGGVETFIYNVVAHSDLDRIHFEFLVAGDKKPVYADELEALCGTGCIHHVPEIRSSGLEGYREVSRFFRENGERFDWMHLNICTAAKVLYCYPFSKRCGFKVLTHSHTSSAFGTLFHRLGRPLLRNVSDCRLACSEPAAEWMFGGDYVRDTRIINNGIDVDRFRFSESERERIRTMYGIPQDAFVIGHVGRFSKVKNHTYLLRVFAELAQYDAQAYLLLIGAGELEGEIRSCCRNYEISERVIFPGLQEDTSPYYSAMDAFVMPSLYEGLPVVGVEAAASGLGCYFSGGVSRQAAILEKTRFLSIDENPSAWVDALLHDRDVLCDYAGRLFAGDTVKDAGYDICYVAKTIDDIYLEE
ncbi:glycosyltransferase [Collinsella tanakaei]|nr:glycosyltransferase [Collinsella tanakaei]